MTRQDTGLMRLVCPNCGAQYDVPLEVIPEAGRDVQCSNCGNTWFQRRVQQPAATPPRTTQDDWEQVPARDTATPPPSPDASETDASPPVPETAPRRSIDPEMAELFREERDFAARQRSAESLETQPDLGLTEPDEDAQSRRARESRERMARMRGEISAEDPALPDGDPDARPVAPPSSDAELKAAAAAAAAASRSEALPDVDELNQTLRSSSEPRVVDSGRGQRVDDTRPRETGSPFARGFALIALLAVLGASAYAMSPRLSASFPAAAPYLATYVETVDAGRAWLDTQVKALLTSLDQMSSEAGDPDAGDAGAPDSY